MRILFFAQLKDVTGCEVWEHEVTSPVGAAELWEALTRRFPRLAPHQASVRLAKNLEYTGADCRFANEDEVALIPPVSGG